MYVSLCFARVFSSGPYAQDIGFNIEDAYLAAIMRSHAIPADVYGANATGRLTDILDRFGATLANRFFFHVDKYNLDLSHFLANALQRRHECTVHLWSHDAALRSNDASILGSTTLLETAFAIAKAAKRTITEPVNAASPYRDPFMASRLASHNEFVLVHPNQLMEDLAWHACLPANKRSQHVIINVMYAEHGAIEAAIQHALSFAAQTHCRYELRMTTQAYLALGPAHPDTAALSFELHGTCPSFSLSANARYAAPADVAALTATYPRNGTLVYFSGAYPDMGAAPAVTHLHIADDASHDMALTASTWAGENMALRSVRLYASLPPAQPQQVWPLHRYVFATTAPGRAVVSADAWNPNTFSLQMESECDTPDRDPHDVNFATASTPSEVRQLFEKVAQFEQTGVLSFDANPAYTVNSCRWASVGRCSQDRLRRIQIDAQGAIRSCIDSPPIGDVTMPFQEIRRNVSRLATDKSLQRGCMRCPVRSDCSRCNAMPEALEDAYCQLRKSHPSLALFQELRLLPLIVPGLAAPSDAPPWRISAPGLPNVFFPAHYRSQWRRPSSIILSRGAATLLWERGTRNISKITNALGFILEAYWCEIEMAVSAPIAAATFGIPEADARKHIEDGLNMLKKGKLCL